MNIDALYNHSRDSLAAARKSLYDLLEALRSTANSDYSKVADAISSIAKAEEDVDGLAEHWQEQAEKSMHGEGLSVTDDLKMVPRARLVENDARSLEDLAKNTELEFDKFFLPGTEEE